MAQLVLPTARMIIEFAACDPCLVAIVADLEPRWGARTMRVTCIGRTSAEDADLGGSGVHVGPPYRALDLRIWNLAPRAADYHRIAGRHADWLNRRWEYDPRRPGRFGVAYAKKHGTGPHLHLQVHRNTRRRGARYT